MSATMAEVHVKELGCPNGRELTEEERRVRRLQEQAEDQIDTAIKAVIKLGAAAEYPNAWKLGKCLSALAEAKSAI